MSRGLSQVLCEDNVKYVQQNEVISTTRGNFDLDGVFFHRRFAKRTCCIELTANRKQLTVLCQDERCLGVHCPENNLNIRIKTDHVTCNGMSGFWARYMQIKAGHIELHPLQTGFMALDSDYFWHSVRRIMHRGTTFLMFIMYL